MPQVRKTQKKARSPSSGNITVIEDGDDIRLMINIDRSEHSAEEIVERIKSVISGMIYVYDQDRSAVEAIGKAYLDGVETGIRNAGPAERGNPEEGLSMGFTSSKLGGAVSH